jgi:WD40 repeat protein
MGDRRRTALSILVASLLAGLSSLGILGCGGGSDTPEWALELPDGTQHGAWSPDGKLFAIPAHDRIELIRPDGSVARRIDVPGVDNSGLACECRLSWTEDGEEIHIVTRPRPRARGGVATVDPDSGDLRSRHLDVHVSYAAWAPQGWPLVLAPGDTVHQAGERRPESYPLLRLSGLEASLGVFMRRGGEITDLSFSPDGSRFLLTEESKRGKVLWVISRDGGKARQLLRVGGTPYASWSPDGREIALGGMRGGSLRQRLYLASVATGKVRLLDDGPIAPAPPAWTPDSRWITYADVEGGVHKVRRDGTDQQLLFEVPDHEIDGLNWSPDGGHLAYTTREIIPSG